MKQENTFRYVIIGNSAAAVGAVEGIRQVDMQGQIAVISKEPYHTYSRPLISYLLQGKTDRERMKYRPDTFYADHGCTAVLGVEAVAIDPKQKHVFLQDGRIFTYEKLLVATGSVPFVPKMDGLEQVERRFGFGSLEDALQLEAALRQDSRVLIVGAGLIGLKCAEGIAQRVSSVDVVELSDRILSSILDADGAARVQKHLEAQGISFHLGCSVTAFEKAQARLSNDAVLPFDIVVVAVGVRPNTALLEQAGAQVQRGVVTDDHQRTSLPDVYAAGDCTESYDVSTGSHRVLALLPNAYRQGESAGIDMAGGEQAYTGAIPMNAIGFFGLHLITAGTYTGEAYVHVDGQNYKKLFYADGVLKGYIMIGDVNQAGIYTALIREQTPLDTIDFSLICEKPGLMAFSKADRKKKLGGAV